MKLLKNQKGNLFTLYTFPNPKIAVWTADQKAPNCLIDLMLIAEPSNRQHNLGYK